MTWTGRPEATACCPGPHGAVHDDERVARLLHDGIDQPETAQFKRTELLPPKDETPYNVCGEQAGASVVRCISLSDENIRQRAAAKPAVVNRGRRSRGAKLARVAALRSIRLEDKPNRQVVFVYDDAIDLKDPLHAIIRIDERLSSDFIDIRDQIIKVFSQAIPP